MARSVKVLHVVPALFGSNGNFGGAERYALELARHVSSLCPTRLVAFSEESKKLQSGVLPIRLLKIDHLAGGSRFNPLSWELVPELLQADVVHFHQRNILTSSCGALLARALGKPAIATDHGGGGLDFSWYFDTSALFDAHLHVSEFSLRQAGHTGRPDAQVIFGGVDARRFHPAPNPSRNYVLFVGRVLPHKGVHDLIDALPDGLELKVAGPLQDEAYAEVLRGRAVGRRVTFCGPVSEDDLVRLYQHALCIVLPSVYESPFQLATAVPELLGQTLLEGMACGTPAICTCVGAMPEVNVHGETGYVVEPASPGELQRAILELRAEPGQAAALGRHARSRIDRYFRWEVVAERCVETYHRLAH